MHNPDRRDTENQEKLTRMGTLLFGMISDNVELTNEETLFPAIKENRAQYDKLFADIDDARLRIESMLPQDARDEYGEYREMDALLAGVEKLQQFMTEKGFHYGWLCRERACSPPEIN